MRRSSLPLALTAVAAVTVATVVSAFPASAGSTTITPSSLTTTAGRTGGQPVAALAARDQSGSDDSWSRYVEFAGRYRGFLQYTARGVEPSSVTGIRVDANYRGPSARTQRWAWSLYDWTTSRWVSLGTNAAAPDWGNWTLLTFHARGSLADYVSPTGTLRVQLRASSVDDVADIDYQSITLTYEPDSAGTSKPAPPTVPPTATSPAPPPPPTAVTTGTGTAPTTPGTPTDAAGPAATTAGTATATASGSTTTGATPSSVALPPFNGNFSYEISAPYGPAPAAAAWVSRAHEDTVASGKYNICYVNAFQAQDAAGKGFPAAALLRNVGGGVVVDPDWNEAILDTRTATSRAAIASVVRPFLDECAGKGFDAVELDNLDTFTRFSQLSQAGNLALADDLVAHARAKGMAVAQKNTLELGSAGPKHFDFLVNEECAANAECTTIAAVWGNRWVDIEYTAGAYATACSQVGATISVNRRDVEVTPGAVDTSC